MNLKQKAIKGVFWSATQSWGSQAISFLVFALLARLLAPETFGLIALAGVFLAFIEVFLDQGFSTAIIQRRELEPEHLDTAFWTNLAIGILMTGASIAAADLIADFYRQPELASIIRWLSISFILRALSAVQEAIFRRNLEFKTLAIRSLISVIAGGIVGVSMAFMGYGVWSLVGQRLSSGLVQITVLWWASNWRPGFKVSRRHFQDLFSFGINIVGINILNFINRRSDDLLIGYFLGPVALGYYNIGYRILLVMTRLLTSTLQSSALPILSRMQEEPQKIRSAFYKITQLSLFLAFPVFLALAALAPELIKVFFGEKWLPSVPVMQILCVIGILHASAYLNGGIMIAMGKPSWKLRINCLDAVANFIAFLIAVQWGIVAVAIAYVIRGFLFMPIGIFAVHKLINIRYSLYLRQYMSPFLGASLMVAITLSVKYLLTDAISLSGLLVINVLLGTIVYLIVISLIERKLLHLAFSLAYSVIPSQLSKYFPKY